jgi:hypothetical protein
VTLEGPAGWREPSPILLLFAEETSIDAMLKHDIMMMRVINGRYRYQALTPFPESIGEMCIRASNKYVGRRGL